MQPRWPVRPNCVIIKVALLVAAGRFFETMKRSRVPGLVPLLLPVLLLVAVAASMALSGRSRPIPAAGPLGASVATSPAGDPRLPVGLSIDGLPVAGLTLEEAAAAVERLRLAPLRRPLTLVLDGEEIPLDPAAVGLQADARPALEQARACLEPNWLHPEAIYLRPQAVYEPEPAWQDLPLVVELDHPLLESFLQDLARTYDQDPRPMQVVPLSDTGGLQAAGVSSATWEVAPVLDFRPACAGRYLDVVASLPAVERALLEHSRRPVTLTVATIPAPRPDLSLLQEVLAQQVARFPGVVGIYVRDLQSGQEAGVHDAVLFSGASVIKIAILLQSYRVLDGPPAGFVADQMAAMMIWSDNDAANWLLAFAGEGDGLRGAEAMTGMLWRLGLGNSYLCNPYYAEGSWKGCPPPQTSASAAQPRTRPDPLLRTTPREMGLLLAAIYDCAAGHGPILEAFPGEVTSGECRAMLEWMGQNDDLDRIVAGLPRGVPVAHKSGWIADMKADAGIVFSPHGAYVLSVFVWEEGGLTDGEGNPRIANLSWVVYAFFNPGSSAVR